MASDFKILDCTLRDGGHVNKWMFGRKAIYDIVYSLYNAKIDIIELGLIKSGETNLDCTLKSSFAEFDNMLEELDLPTHQYYTLMVRPDWLDIDSFHSVVQSNHINGVRFAFYPDQINRLRDFVDIAKDHGLDIYLNPVAVSTYSDLDLTTTLSSLVNLSPHAISIVDTFGNLDKKTLPKLFHTFHSHIPDIVNLGIHLHENRNLSLELALSFIELCATRSLSFIDASLLGMGRIPGNLCIENLLTHLSSDLNYDFTALLSVIDKHISPIKRCTPWGYSPPYMLSAIYNINRNYPEFFLDMNLDTQQINLLLKSLFDLSPSAAFSPTLAKQLINDLNS